MKKITNYKNRGLDFEKMIDETNKFYVKHSLAFVYKKPTPIQVLKVIKGNKIEGVFSTKSTTDYNGLYNGNYVDFDAKVTTNEIFDLNNIKPHQYKHLQDIHSNKGISFILVFFKVKSKIFLIPFEMILKHTTKNMTYEFCLDNCYCIPIRVNPVIDYLQAIDEWQSS